MAWLSVSTLAKVGRLATCFTCNLIVSVRLEAKAMDMEGCISRISNRN